MTNRPKQDPGQLTLLDLIPRTCASCGGTILAPTIGGVPRGTCHCPRETERFTDWTAARVGMVKQLALRDCCKLLIVQYETAGSEMAVVAKQRGGVALYCPRCCSRVTFSDGRWQREGEV